MLFKLTLIHRSMHWSYVLPTVSPGACGGCQSQVLTVGDEALPDPAQEALLYYLTEYEASILKTTTDDPFTRLADPNPAHVTFELYTK